MGKKIIFFFQFFFLITSKVQWFCKFWWLHRKNHIKICRTTSCFYFKKKLKQIKNRYFLVKNWIIQVIASVIMLTRSSERIFIECTILVYYMKWLQLCLLDTPLVWNRKYKKKTTAFEQNCVSGHIGSSLFQKDKRASIH